MQRMNIKCCHCGDYTPFIAEENIEVIPQVNLTRTDMDILGDIAEALAKCGWYTYGFPHLLEVCGLALVDHYDVEGWLTARQVMKMWRRRNAAKNR